MIYANDWRDSLHFRLVHNDNVFEVEHVKLGYLVWVWKESDVETDMPVPKFYGSLRNGDVHDQDVEAFVIGFKDALCDPKTLYYNLEESYAPEQKVSEKNVQLILGHLTSAHIYHMKNLHGLSSDLEEIADETTLDMIEYNKEKLLSIEKLIEELKNGH